MIDMTSIHRAFCCKNGIKYLKKNMVRDLRWQCFAVSTVLAEMLKVEGQRARAVYGFWHGKCASKPGAIFHRHGWVVVGDEIWDATRWVFEDQEPYLFKGKVSKHPEYDEGMRAVRSAMPRPFPVPGAGQVYEFKWSYPTYMFLCELINAAGGKGADPMKMSYQQIMWVGNQDYLKLGDFIDEIYKTFVRMDLAVTIPRDYLEWWRANK